MENREEEIRKSPEGIEHDYNKHKENPGPSEEAVTEKNEEGGGLALKWIIPICLVVLLVVYLIMRE
ncbi:MAG TPA: hypothetical protein VFM79_11740 [Pelobium sp.]|nr:hypothetical protein [Pelobium sp.]